MASWSVQRWGGYELGTVFNFCSLEVEDDGFGGTLEVKIQDKLDYVCR